tara:strand:+ start:7194 stop:7652 length:459 start_codon:yes stop_codon:yes gene_type:complete
LNIKKKIIAFLIALFIGIQLYPVDKPEVIVDNPNDLITTTTVPKNIASKLKAACYDCHSNESNFRWYATIAPSKWLVYKDINQAREELNFSNWNTYNKEDKAELLDDISTVLYDNEMPLKNYTALHSEAKLTEEDKEAIINWTDQLLDSLYE